MNGTLIVLSIFDLDWLDLGTRRIMAALLVLIIWAKMFSWLRMFDTTAFFIKLIKQTLADIMPFVIIFPIFLAMFGCSMYILSTSREAGHEVIEEALGIWVLDMFIN